MNYLTYKTFYITNSIRFKSSLILIPKQLLACMNNFNFNAKLPNTYHYIMSNKKVVDSLIITKKSLLNDCLKPMLNLTSNTYVFCLFNTNYTLLDTFFKNYKDQTLWLLLDDYLYASLSSKIQKKRNPFYKFSTYLQKELNIKKAACNINLIFIPFTIKTLINQDNTFLDFFTYRNIINYDN